MMWTDIFGAIQDWITVDRAMMLQYMYSCAVQSLPSPQPMDNWVYRWVYGWAHTFAGNIGLIRKRREEGSLIQGLSLAPAPPYGELQARMDSLQKLVEEALEIRRAELVPTGLDPGRLQSVKDILKAYNPTPSRQDFPGGLVSTAP